MSRIVGIDLGTTNSLVATVDSGIPLVLADAQGHRLTPSVVHFPDPGIEPIVGHPANRLRMIKPADTVYSVKRFIGRRGNELSQEEMLVTYPIKGEGSEPVTVEIHGRAYRSEEISAEILKKLKSDAAAYFGEPITRTVITVPAYFNDAQRHATKRAGEFAGLAVERMINEPTAAALAYGLDKLKEHARIAVYDLGGGTFDLSILELNEGVFQVLATHGNLRLWGDHLDKRMHDFLVEIISAQGGPAVATGPHAVAGIINLQAPRPDQVGDKSSSTVMLSRIREAAEQAKIRLSDELEVEINLPFLAPNFSFSLRLTRAQLENLTRD